MTAPAAGAATLLRNFFADLADLVLPGACWSCGTPDIATAGLCEACNVQLLSLVAQKYCPRCGATIGPNLPVREDGCWLCPNPLPRFAGVIRLGPYTSALRKAVRHVKYRRREGIRRRLGRLLAEAVKARRPELPFDLILPVPMHWRRRLVRGYDHSRMLAQTLAGELNLPMGHELIRIRHTPPQVHLPRSRRIENMRGAFAVTAGSGIDGARVLLVDDVTTTGATAGEAAKTLLAKAASRVDLAVIAKAQPPIAYADHGQ